jgi:hypothetical protein
VRNHGTTLKRPHALTPAPDDHVAIEVVTSSGRACAVEFRLRPTVVEVRHSGNGSVLFDRATLWSWLVSPGGTLASGDVRFTLDRMVDHNGRVAISLPGVDCWTISPAEVDALMKRL